MKTVGLDLSLTGAGVATADTAPGYPAFLEVKQYGSKPTGNDLARRSLRLRGLASPIIRDCVGASLVLVEAPAYAQTSGHSHERSGLWWLIIASLTSRGIPCVEVVNNHLKMYALGKGGGKGVGKDQVLAAVIRRYPTVNVQTNNEADALVLAAMGARHLECPIERDLPATHLRAMAAVKWPDHPTKEVGQQCQRRETGT